MPRHLRSFLGAFLLVAPGLARGQSPASPILLGVEPPGATVGQEVEWSIAGRNLAKVDRVIVSGLGVVSVGLSARTDSSARAKVRVAPDAPPGFREVRLDGPDGVSNLVVVRVDNLRQVVEADPRPDVPQVVEVGSAVVGLLRPLEVDTYQIRGTPGRRLTLDLEARRLGTPISPVLTTLSESGAAIAQARESPGGDRDARLSAVVPPGGSFLVQVRDNTYGGGDRARYRLRVDPAPFATAAFPLGGRAGEVVEVEVSGGNLDRPRRKSIRLPDVPGSLVEIGPVDGPGGALVSPGKLLVGEGPEAVEPADVAPGTAIHGRLDRPGEVDRFRIAARAGERLRARVEAVAMGSWLDSLVVVRDAAGESVAENDDGTEGVRPDQARAVGVLGIPGPSPDSSVDFEARADGLLTVEVSDRFGRGGPEYGYRLTVGEARPDFAVTLLLGNPNATAAGLAGSGASRASPGQFGLFNLRPGTSAPINFLVAPIGRPGPVEVRVEGLPEGVTAEPVSVRFPGPSPSGSPAGAPVSPVADSIPIRVAPGARPGLSEFRVVATARPAPGIPLRREASGTVGLSTGATANRPVTRVIGRIPIRVLGDPDARAGP